jgi:hypothetical protein
LLVLRRELLRKERVLKLLILNSLILKGELLALRRALILKLRALPTPILIIRLRTLASRVKLVVLFTEVRAKGRQGRHKGRKA